MILGSYFDTGKSKGAEKDTVIPSYHFEPKRPVVYFTNYIVRLTISDSLIYQIIAEGKQSDALMAELRREELRQILEKKYGIRFEIVSRIKGDVIYWADKQGRSIMLTSQDNRLRIGYSDRALWDRLNREFAEKDPQKVDKSAL